MFNDAPTSGYLVEVTVSSDGSGLDAAPSEISDVVSNLDNILIVAGIESDVTTVATNNANVTTVATNIASVNTTTANIADINTVASLENLNDIMRVADDLNAIDANGIADVTIVATDLVKGVNSSIDIDANSIDNINIVAEAITAGSGIGSGTSGQFAGTALIKGVQYMAQTSDPNEVLELVVGTNGFSIDNFTLANGASLTIQDGVTYKVL